jgi:hypothetical protein
MPACSTPRGHEAPPRTLTASTSYLRSERLDNGTSELQIACRRFTARSHPGVSVWLVGASHIGSADYYKSLQALLDSQGIVLFEGVRASQDAPVRGQAMDREAMEGSLQGSLARSLGLTFQLTQIDYSRGHFRNSDLSVPELQKLISANLESATADSGDQDASVQFSVLLQALDGDSWLSGVARMVLGFLQASPKVQALAKLTMIEVSARVGGDLESAASGNAGMKKLLAVLVDARNRRVVQDLRQSLRRPEAQHGIAIFYGAAHMKDFEQRLRHELGFRPVEERWLTAFGVNPKAAGLGPEDEKTVRSMVDWQLGAIGKPPSRK